MPVRSLVAGVALLCLVSAASSGSARSPQITVSLGDALTYYEAGERDAVIRALVAARGSDAFALGPFFEKNAEAWIQADGPDHVDRRRLIVATFALETAHAGLDHQWEISKQVVQWACEMWRRSGPPTPEEHQWTLAALALLEGSFEPGSAQRGLANLPLRAHLGHITDRFPDEPRVALALALLEEYDFWIGHYRASPGRDPLFVVHDDAIAATVLPALEAAAGHEATRAEALLRRGFLEYRLGRLDDARANLTTAAEGDEDPTRTYLAHLFIGWVHERAGRMTEATASFRRAYEIIPALSAALALGVRLYEDEADERDEADRLAEAALLGASGQPDPWQQYGYGDLRLWPTLIGDLRWLAGVS